jgi:hypothetical protein
VSPSKLSTPANGELGPEEKETEQAEGREDGPEGCRRETVEVGEDGIGEPPRLVHDVQVETMPSLAPSQAETDRAQHGGQDQVSEDDPVDELQQAAVVVGLDAGVE